MNLKQVIAGLKTERDRLDRAIVAISGLNRKPGRGGARRAKRKLSKAARAKIAAAQRARWAKVRAGKK